MGGMGVTVELHISNATVGHVLHVLVLSFLMISRKDT